MSSERVCGTVGVDVVLGCRLKKGSSLSGCLVNFSLMIAFCGARSGLLNIVSNKASTVLGKIRNRLLATDTGFDIEELFCKLRVY